MSCDCPLLYCRASCAGHNELTLEAAYGSNWCVAMFGPGQLTANVLRVNTQWCTATSGICTQRASSLFPLSSNSLIGLPICFNDLTLKPYTYVVTSWYELVTLHRMFWTVITCSINPSRYSITTLFMKSCLARLLCARWIGIQTAFGTGRKVL